MVIYSDKFQFVYGCANSFTCMYKWPSLNSVCFKQFNLAELANGWIILIMSMGRRQWEVGRNNDLCNHYEFHGWHRYSFINLASVNWELVCVCVCVCVRVWVPQLCLTLCDPMDYSLPGSSVHWILQARILEWIAIPFSRGSSWPRDRIQVSCIVGGLFTIWATREALVVDPIITVGSGI